MRALYVFTSTPVRFVIDDTFQGSWVFLNRHTVRGDYALVFYVLSAAILHYFVQASAWLYSPLLVTLSLISAYFASLAATTVGYRLSPWHPLAQYPGPTLWKVSSLFLSKISLTGRRHKILDRLHQRYGPILRIGQCRLMPLDVQDI